MTGDDVDVSVPDRKPPRALAAASALARAALRPERPDRLPRAMAGDGWPRVPTMAGGVAAATARYPTGGGADRRRRAAQLRRAVDGDRRRRPHAAAPAASVRPAPSASSPATIAAFVTSVVAAAKLGTDIVYLNTGFAGPQLADVVVPRGHRHRAPRRRVRADRRGRGCPAHGVAAGARRARRRALVPAAHADARTSGAMVILTSGTTGRPKGAARASVGGVDALTAAAVDGADPRPRHRRHRRPAVPRLGSRAPRHRRSACRRPPCCSAQFDPEAVAGVDRRAPGRTGSSSCRSCCSASSPSAARCSPATTRRRCATSRPSGSALGAPLATAVIRRFGPILYNIYGSTEVSLATVAGPADLQAAPGDGRPAGAGQHRCGSSTTTGASRSRRAVGRVFVGSRCPVRGLHRRRRQGGHRRAAVESATSGTSTARGRLFIDGRDDDMIVSGGENVFPAEVEDLLAAHPAVAEAAVIGVADEEFGQRLKAFVVRRPGARLTERPGQGPRPQPSRPLQGARRGRLRRRPAAHDDRQAAPPRPPPRDVSRRRTQTGF